MLSINNQNKHTKTKNENHISSISLISHINGIFLKPFILYNHYSVFSFSSGVVKCILHSIFCGSKIQVDSVAIDSSFKCAQSKLRDKSINQILCHKVKERDIIDFHKEKEDMTPLFEDRENSGRLSQKIIELSIQI